MQAITASVIAAALLVPTLAVAQDSQPPGRVGNVWDNKSHQPTQSEVTQQEKAAGLGGSAAAERQQTEELEELDKQVLERAQQGAKDGILNGTEATKPLPP